MTDPDDAALFEALVTVHPDHGQRVAWTVPTPAELRDRGVAQVDRHASSWERDAIDKALADAIAAARAAGGTFTANDLRAQLPEGVHRPLIGARFLAAAKAGRVVRIGYARSTDPRTRSAVVAVWRPA